MSKRKPRDKKQPAGQIGFRAVEGQKTFEFVHPRCARERASDLEEVHLMLEAGEIDVAEEELRWLLDGCQACIEAHRLLGEIAMADNDLALARGHFGYAYQLGLSALPDDGRPRRFPYARPANKAFLEAGKGLAWSLQQLGEAQLAAEVIQQMLALDPTDPLAVRNIGR